MIKMIACVDLMNGLGKDNDLLVKLPNDLKRFKQITLNHPIIMGRKTYESIGRPLPNRTNIVITSDKSYNPHEDVYVYHNIDDILNEYYNHAGENETDVFIIGGETIYKQFLPYADEIYLTVVPHVFNADVFFPEIYEDEWESVKHEHHSRDVNNQYDYIFTKYVKINK